MWDIKEILKDFYRTKDLQQFINNRFKSDSMFVVPNGKFVIIRNNKQFYLDDMFLTFDDVDAEYKLDDLRPTDIVLDIGACIGAFSLKVANNVKHVFAVEPIFTERIKRNIALNNINNISVLEYALGNGDLELSFIGRTKRINGKKLSEIIKLCGGHVDFLKCDCEGGEWSITPDELKGIRRIEAEIHCFKGMPKLEDFEVVLKAAGFEFEKEILSEVAMIIHAKNKGEVSTRYKNS